MRFLFILFLLTTSIYANDLRDEAYEKFEDGELSEALKDFEKLVVTKESKTLHLDIPKLIKTYEQSKQPNSIDDKLRELSKLHRNNATALLGIAKTYESLPHSVYQKEQVFFRGVHEDYKKQRVIGHDRMAAMYHANLARKLIKKNPSDYSMKFKRELYLFLLDIWLTKTAPREFYKLTPIFDSTLIEYFKENTDPNSTHFRLPTIGPKSHKDKNKSDWTYLEVKTHSRMLFSQQQPVVFFNLPENEEVAKSNGEIIQLIRAEAKALHPKLALKADALYAYSQEIIFGSTFPKTGDGYYDEIDTAKMHRLNDSESYIYYQEGDKVAKYKKITIPDEHNFLKIHESLFKNKHTSGFHLSNIYLSRGQTVRAAKLLKKASKRTDDYAAQIQHTFLTGDYFEFKDQTKTYPVNHTPIIPITVRNVESFKLTIQKIDSEKFIQDSLTRFKHENFNDYYLNYTDLPVENLTEYASINSQQTLHSLPALEKYKNHDLEFKFPTDQAGTYLVTATLEDGKSIKTVITISSITAIINNTAKGIQITVTDILSGAPIPNAEINLYNLNRSEHTKQTSENSTFSHHYKISDKNGTGLFSSDNSNYDSLLVQIKQDNHHVHTELIQGFSPLIDKQSSELTSSIILTDRPIYSPGETIHIKSIFRSPNNDRKNYIGKKYTLSLSKVYDNSIESIDIYPNPLGFSENQFKLTNDLEPGSYRLTISDKTRQTIAEHSIAIYPYKAPEYKLEIESNLKSLNYGDDLNITIRAHYFHGNKVNNGMVSLKIHPKPTTIKTNKSDLNWLTEGNSLWENHKTTEKLTEHFDSFTVKDQVKSIIKTKLKQLDKNGEMTFTIPFDKIKPILSHFGATISVSATFKDRSNNEISELKEVYYPGKECFAHLKSNKNFAAPNEPIDVTLKTTMADDSLIASEGTLKAYRIKDTLTPKTELILHSKQKIVTNSQSPAKYVLHFSQPGKYRIIATFSDHVSVEKDITILATNNLPPTDKAIELLTKKTCINASQRTQIAAISKYKSGTLFIQNHNGSHYKPYQLKNYHCIIPIKTNRSNGPNFYVRGFIVRDGIISEHSVETYVPPHEVELKVSAHLAKQSLKPQESTSVTIQVTDQNNTPIKGNVILAVYDQNLDFTEHAVVQQSLYQLWQKKHQQQPHLSSSLKFVEHSIFENSRHQMSPIWNTRKQEASLEALKNFDDWFTRNDHVSASGGASFFNRHAPSPYTQDNSTDITQKLGLRPRIRREFKKLLAWHPNLETDENGKITLPIKFPDNLTTWKFQVWAIDEDSKYGNAVTTATVTKDLLIRSIAPQYLTQQDQLTLKTITHNYSAKDLDTNTVLESQNQHLTLNQKKSTTTKLAAQKGEHSTTWNLKATTHGNAKLIASSTAENFSDTLEQLIPIHRYGIPTLQSESIELSRSQQTKNISLTLPKEYDKESVDLNIGLNVSILDAVNASIPYLYDYEHGCAEQTLNKFLPAVLCHQLNASVNNQAKHNANVETVLKNGVTLRYPTFKTKDDIYEKLNSSIQRLAKLQHSRGGWSWFDNNASDRYITDVVTHGLLRTHQSGFLESNHSKISQQFYEMLKSALNNLENHAKKATRKLDSKFIAESFTFSLFILSESSHTFHQTIDSDKRKKKTKTITTLFDKIYQSKDQLSLKPLSQLALSANSLNRQEEWKTLLQQIITQHKEATAITAETLSWILQVYAKADPTSTLSSNTARELLQLREHGTHWKSTLDTAHCINALTKYASTQNQLNTEGDITIQLNQNEIIKVDITQGRTPSSIKIPASLINSDTIKLNFTTTSNNPIYLSASLNSFNTSEDFIAPPSKLEIKRQYFIASKNKKRNKKNGKKAHQLLQSGDTINIGDTVIVKLTILNPKKETYLNIKSPKAAGFTSPEKLPYNITRQHPKLLDPFAEYPVLAHRVINLTHSNLYIDAMTRKKLTLEYKLKAEFAGTYTALPAQIESMYDPKINHHTDKFTLTIQEPVE